MPLTLSLNTNPLVNRFADPDDLITTVARDMRIRDLQLTHEFINPSWPAPVIRRLTRRMGAALSRTGVRVTSGMTGPYGRLNHFGHPDRDVRRYYVDWFKTFADITADLGGTSVGTQFAIFTYQDFDDPKRREELIQIAIDCWAEVADHAKAAGLTYVFWEPMSIGREYRLDAVGARQWARLGERMRLPKQELQSKLRSLVARLPDAIEDVVRASIRSGLDRKTLAHLSHAMHAHIATCRRELG